MIELYVVAHVVIELEHVASASIKLHPLLISGMVRWICTIPHVFATPWQQLLPGAASLCLSNAQDIGIALWGSASLQGYMSIRLVSNGLMVAIFVCFLCRIRYHFRDCTLNP
ncbi:TPA: hypothetical protein P2H93_003599 [Aeromonas veronii AMC24]|uniref:hypothetical protein n=1 Tax=Aeromonas TaxID=642 RepID=UPI0021D828FB|nr:MULTISPECIES: hypothetical protein [Aeromonas]MCX7132391.1 hypothetical protein [Aeromonas sp.]UYB71389.1 hypothetical protein NBH81_02475 [Aeromonas veronii]HDN9003742.1 hypothetical protein [Aeromonas veronii AMC24]